MANNEFLGSALYASWVATGGGTVTLQTESRNFGYTPSMDVVDATAGADTGKRVIASFKGGQVSCTMVMQNDQGTAEMTALAEGTLGTLTWGEAGTATGKPKHVAPFMSLGYTSSVPYNDVVTYTVSLQQNGARTDSAWA